MSEPIGEFMGYKKVSIIPKEWDKTTGQIILDGIDISSYISSIEIIWEAGEYPKIKLTIAGYIEIPEMLASLIVEREPEQ